MPTDATQQYGHYTPYDKIMITFRYSWLDLAPRAFRPRLQPSDFGQRPFSRVKQPMMVGGKHAICYHRLYFVLTCPPCLR